MIPLSYCLLSLVSLAIFTRQGNYEFYRVSQLILILLLPFFLMIALGGFANSSAVILWSVLCPFGALLFAKATEPPRWMILYIILVLLGGIVQPLTRESNNLPPPLVLPIFFVLNILAVTGIALILLRHFVSDALIKDEFDLEPRGLVQIRGKGEMETWFVIGRKELSH